MEQVVETAKALSDENRVRVLLALRRRELCVCQIVELLDLAPSTVSKHMAVLRRAGLVEARREGRWIHYRRAEPVTMEHVRASLAWVDRFAGRSATAREDRARLREILKLTPEDLCRIQAGS